MKEHEIAKNNVENLKLMGNKALIRMVCRTHLTTLQRFLKFFDDHFVYGYRCGCEFCQKKKNLAFDVIRDIQRAVAIYGGAGIR